MQGRVRSLRLPGKGFFTFFGQTLWERMCDIGKEIRGANEVVFATGDHVENRLVQPLIESKGVRFFMGSEDNVLQRYCDVVRDSSAEYVVRLTCDNYLIQPELVEALAAAVREKNADYGYIEPLSHYAGEVIRREVLLQEYRSGKYTPLAREHVSYDIRQSTTYRQVTLPADYGGVDHRHSLTLDTLDDLLVMKRLERSYPGLAQPRSLEELRKVDPTKS